MDLLVESVERYCHFYLASNGGWYMELAHREHGDEQEAATYGPFTDEDAAVDYLDNFSNPGGFTTDDTGTAPVPTRSPDGSRVEQPSNWMAPLAHATKPKTKPAPKQSFSDTVSTPPAPHKGPSFADTVTTKPGKKETYKVYGKLGQSPLHARIKGRPYGPTTPSKFKKGSSARVNVKGDDLDITDVDTGHSQKWRALEHLVREFVQLIRSDHT